MEIQHSNVDNFLPQFAGKSDKEWNIKCLLPIQILRAQSSNILTNCSGFTSFSPQFYTLCYIEEFTWSLQSYSKFTMYKRNVHVDTFTQPLSHVYTAVFNNMHSICHFIYNYVCYVYVLFSQNISLNWLIIFNLNVTKKDDN